MIPEMKDSGERQGFDTGAVRDTSEGKPQYHLLPPFAWGFVHTEYGKYVKSALASSSCPRDVYTLFEQLYVRLWKDVGMPRLLEWLRQGAEKYSKFNWAKGIPITRCLDSLGRHFVSMMAGADDEDHGAAAFCNVTFICHYLDMIDRQMMDPAINDLFDFDRSGGHHEQS